MIWTALQRYSTMFIQFISGIILARLLTPHDYGYIGMLMIFIVLAETFIEGCRLYGRHSPCGYQLRQRHQGRSKGRGKAELGHSIGVA